VSAARLSVTPRGAPGPVVVRDRAWLVSDALVVSRLSTHAVLPVRDVALQRGARAVAFALGLLALPDAGPASIAAVDLVLDAEQLGERIALPPSAIGEAFRALWVADVLRHGSAPGMARFADDLVPETSLAYALRWSVVTERLLDRSGEGSLAAVMLFRLLLDRVSHPHAPAALPASLVAEQLGLSEDQSRRGMKALLQRELLVEQPHAGRAKQYLLAPGVLLGQATEVPAAPVAAPAAVAPMLMMAGAATAPLTGSRHRPPRRHRSRPPAWSRPPPRWPAARSSSSPGSASSCPRRPSCRWRCRGPAWPACGSTPRRAPDRRPRAGSVGRHPAVGRRAGTRASVPGSGGALCRPGPPRGSRALLAAAGHRSAALTPGVRDPVGSALRNVTPRICHGPARWC
jgi:hypothetical protein